MKRIPTQLWMFAMTMSFASNLPQPSVQAQERKVNQDEALVDMGPLPDPLAQTDGSQATRESWNEHRQQLLNLIADNQFGHLPNLPFQLEAEVTEEGLMHDGKTLRRQMELTISTDAGSQLIDIAIFTPAKTPLKGIFFGLNFRGNHTVDEAPELRLPRGWVPNEKASGGVNNQATEAGRGTAKRSWPVAEITERGFGLATVYCGDIDPDFHDGFDNGVHRLFPAFKPSKEQPNRWGTISAWAWGLSRMVDATESLPNTTTNFAVIGHSRLGKASLWAGANDERFNLVITNNSGCGGAALERRNFGETVAVINRAFPHWFCENFRKYNDNEQAMPHDAHFIVASLAPRPAYIGSATEDLWADPKGEYLAGYHANPAYALFGLQGLPGAEPPPADTPVGEHLGYHNRTGKHALLSYDWQRYMDFADKHWSK